MRRIKFFPSAQKLAYDVPVGIDNAESSDVDGTVLFDLIIPTVIHHLLPPKKKTKMAN